MYVLDNDDIKIELLRHHNNGLSSRAISKILGISKSAINDFLARKTYQDWWAMNAKPIASGELQDHRSGIKQLSGKKFILTSAQNNTFVNENFLKSLEVMADDINADIIVGTFSYNKNGFQNGADDDVWYDPSIVKYIMDEPVLLTDGLLWCGELNILPTAVNPLSGLHSYTKNMSGIVPHTKVQMESLPTHKTEEPRLMYTTGTVTKRNYIQQKAGQKASFHHIFGAVLVEVDNDGDWFVRHLISESTTGSFQDLDTLYTPEGVVKNQHVEAINYGDIHIEKIDHSVMNAILDKGGMLDVLKPKFQLIHDVLDFEARNHHNINDPYFRMKMHIENREKVRDNILAVSNFLQIISRDYCETVVVESNHDLAFQRWLKEADYKSDPVNAVYFLENQLESYKAIFRREYDFSIFEHAVKQFMEDKVNLRFLRTDESFKICDEDGNGIECGSHGHLGTNGARGSINAYQKMGTRHNIGHSHTAAIKDGVYVAGVSAQLDMGYNKGGSSWSQSHIVTYPNGKRTIVTMRNGKWRAK